MTIRTCRRPTIDRVSSTDRLAIVGDDRCFVIAEAGVNHNGSEALAHELIDRAVEAGADGVKFQTFRASAVASCTAPTAAYQAAAGQGSDQLQMLARLELPESVWRELKSHADERGVLFLSTAFDVESLEFLVSIDVGCLKVPSGEIDNVEFLKAHAATGLPVLASTGGSTIEEVDRAVELLSVGGPLSLFHCVTAYPAPVADANLRAIPAMIDRYALPVGWSDHTSGPTSAIAAVALGASIVEKHITTDRRLEGPDHAASANPVEFAAYVRAIRETTAALGDGVKRPMPSEIATIRLARRSFHAARDLPRGHVLQQRDLRALRPAVGVSVSESLVGRVLAAPVDEGAPIFPQTLRVESDRFGEHG